MKEFNRESQLKAVIHLTCLFISVSVMIVAIVARNWIVALISYMVMLLYYVVIKPLMEHFLPDFNYYKVEAREDFLIFSWGDGDKRAVCRLYAEYTYDKKNIIIYDCNSVITVPYHKELIKFLEGL